jgi:EAL domain-containing protein (putative c-di-GMP-specific phosphodiesterase class I)
VVRFAVSLGKTTTAEGVETKEQLDILRAEACAETQGYYFRKPICGSEVMQMVLRQVQPAVRRRKGARALAAL